MRRLSQDPAARPITIDLEGEPLPALEGEPLACSLLAAGETVFSRSIKYHRPRGPFCMDGACSHCLMRVDGVPNVFTCRTAAKPNMRLERQNAYPSAKVDIFNAIDFLFPNGLDHHEMFAGVPIAETVMQKVARHLAGLGLLPDKPAPERLVAQERQVPVAIVGAGAAGLGAAEELTRRRIPFLLVERDAVIGGRLRSAAPFEDDPGVPSAGAFPQGALLLDSSAIGLYEDDRGQHLVVVTPGPQVLKVYAKRFLLTPGGHAEMLPFEGNDLPGVYAGRAASMLLRRHRLLPGEEIALCGRGEELYAQARLYEAHGAKLTAVVDVEGPPPENAPKIARHGEPISATGRTRVKSFRYMPKGGKGAVTVDCDALVVAVPPSPAFELARQGGARVAFRPANRAFVVEADEVGHTHARSVFVAGDVTGAKTARQAYEDGKRAAERICEEVAS